jgi:aspartate kinase
MPIIVQKYGGSSVADVEKIKAVAERVKKRRDEGHQLVVVVSAMGDTTDELLTLAKRISHSPHRRELDMLLTCGERISMALLSMALQEMGVPAISFTGSQSGIITDGNHAQARIVEVKPLRIYEELDKGKVVIVAGYQGVSRDREVTTLGRGGSDTTAVALAAALAAEACEIYSDVDGIFSADPRVVPDASKLESLSYEEMQALAHAGARVLNAQAVEFAKQKGIVIHAKSAHAQGTGSRVQGSVKEGARAKAVTCDLDIAVLGVESQALGGPLLGALAAQGVSLRHFTGARVQGDGGAWLVLPLQDVHGEGELKKTLERDLNAPLAWRNGLATVTCVGTGLGTSPRAIAQVMDGASAEGAEVFAVSATPLEVSILVDASKAKSVTQRLHQVLVAPGS